MYFLGLDDGNQGKTDIIGGYEQDVEKMRGKENAEGIR